jgi:AAA family ATP:ADP antiporter
MVSLITGGLFFAFLIFKDMPFMAGVCEVLGATAPALAMWIGLAQNVSTKSAKYSLFDPTKEMAYIPLDEESKIKGKAAIDVIGGRAGKSGGGVINMTVGKFFSDPALKVRDVAYKIHLTPRFKTTPFQPPCV